MPLMAVGLWARAAKSGVLGGDRTFQFVKKIYDQGQKFVQKAFSRATNKDVNVVKKPIISFSENATPHRRLENSLFWRIFPQQARKTLAGELRRKATYQFWGPMAGKRTADRMHLLGFAGFAFALSQNKEEDSIGEKIRSLFSDYSPKVCPDEAVQPESLSLDKLEFGHLLGKGCNAAVYEARFKNSTDQEDPIFCEEEQEESDIESDFSVISEESSSDSEDFFHFTTEELQVSLATGEALGNITPDVEQKESVDTMESDENCPVNSYNMAVKMMFNYGVESNTDSIYRAMIQELVPARLQLPDSDTVNVWQNGNHVKKKSLPPHPNIVDMWGVFVDPVPCLSDSMSEYPAALPQKFNPGGIGRNKTMFLVMKKYGQTLRDFLIYHSPTMDVRIKIFVQVLEGVVHMAQNGISHRDLKSDNILVDFDEDCDVPAVIITDFGCCLADRKHGLTIPYSTDQVEKGGNCALMAPEIACAEPGPWTYLDYSLADLWAVGALAYEIFGMNNPFYLVCQNSPHLDSWSYADSDLPRLPAEVPSIIRHLVYDMLKRDPRERPSPEVAANIVHLYLWAPSIWLSQGRQPLKKDIDDWLMVLVAQTLLEEGSGLQQQIPTSLQLRMTFLARLDMKELFLALGRF